MVTSSSSGKVMYEALGEDANNPWGTKLDDGWVQSAAVQAGFSSPCTPAADVYFRRLFVKAVREHPLDYVRIVITRRLPAALASPSDIVDCIRLRQVGFTFASFKANEGLGVMEVIMKYPMKVLRAMWAEALIRLLALFMFCSVGYVCITNRNGRWLALPVVTVILSICLVNEVEPKTLCSILPAEVLAVAVMLDNMLARRISD